MKITQVTNKKYGSEYGNYIEKLIRSLEITRTRQCATLVAVLNQNYKLICYDI